MPFYMCGQYIDMLSSKKPMYKAFKNIFQEERRHNSFQTY